MQQASVEPFFYQHLISSEKIKEWLTNVKCYKKRKGALEKAPIH
jgi:hypothetical protein